MQVDRTRVRRRAGSEHDDGDAVTHDDGDVVGLDQSRLDVLAGDG